ncbi:MAG: GH25 family lysozyme [Parasphingopyxis sp.]
MRAIKWGAMWLLLAALAAIALWQVAIRWHPSSTTYPFQGVDVSHHQGTIDWIALREGGVSFAYIKATEGGDWRDPMFDENWHGAEAAGIRRGAYHFFTLCRSGEAQAANFINAIPNDHNALAPVVDLEFVGNCSRRPSRTELHRELSDFIEIVEEYSGRSTILYVISDFDDYYGITEAFDRRLWLRALYRQPAYGQRDWVIWQASAFRRIDGVEGPVDWNVLQSSANLNELGE